MIIKKVDFKTFIKESKLKIIEDKTCEYYLILSDVLSGYFLAYDNHFHKNNKYIETNLKLLNDNQKQIFREISNYFKKPLQVMISSNEEIVINNLKSGGFVLMRRSFACEFKQSEFIDDFKEVQIELINQTSLQYQKITEMAFEHYRNAHLNINPLSANINEFKKILPKVAYLESLDGIIVNYVFIEENELCYMGSNKLNSFKDFAGSVISTMFKKYELIFFEVDDNDRVAMILPTMFSKEIKESFNTFVLDK